MGNGNVPTNPAKGRHPTPDQIEVSQSKRSRRDTEEVRDGVYNNNRIRISRACDECRRRKDRCDGQRPSCQPCSVAKRACNYNPSKKRGLRTGYVRSLEMLLGFFFGTVEGSEAWMSAILEGNATKPTLQLRASTEIGQDAAEFAMHTWRKSDVLKRLENLPSLAESAEDDDETCDTFEGRLAQALGGIAAMDNLNGIFDTPSFEGPAQVPLSPMNTDATSPVIIPAVPSHHIAVPQEIVPRPNTTTTCSTVPRDELGITSHSTMEKPSDDDRMDLPTNWSYLLDLHFANTHCWLPISHKHDLLRTAYTLANNANPPNLTDPSQNGDCAFLWAALAYSSHQSDALDVIQGQTSPKRISTDCLLATAKRLATCEEGAHAIGHVRAWILLALLEMAHSHWKTALVKIGQAVYIAAGLGILPGLHTQTLGLEEGVKRTIMGCIALETLIATRLHVRPYFMHSDIRTLGSLQTEGIEEWEPWQPRMPHNPQSSNYGAEYRHSPGHVLSIFSQFMEIMELLNKLLTHPSRQSCCQEIVQSLEHLKPTIPLLRPDSSGTESSPQLLNLHLAFNCVEKMIRSEQLLLPDSQISQPANESWSNTRKLGEVLSERVQGIGYFWIPPSVLSYLFIFRQLLDGEKKSIYDTFGDEERKGLSTSLSGLEHAWRDINTAASDLTHLSANDGVSLLKYKKQNHQDQEAVYLNMDLATTPLVATSSAPQLCTQGSIQHQSGTLQTVENTSLEALHSTSRHGVPSESQIVMNDRIRPPPQSLDFGSLSDSLVGTMDDDGLFDSLANLDPEDWVANPPEFMRHLGDLRDAPTDLQSFFEEN
ncbi:hypothetical protein BGZ61DRAFT_512762 [Ilyonectria robusta]|uniref:uncharacterized protein n=1 Tax=Ilyonectria robusta TaxID=1079257 RepID=UPI001E8EEE99|nr:uncharacterized protein BGZ61DRAFT_512762 [Ilyonectria robusta]KAH8738391.1 hypothetical protein BGZ61DRAFT_512762 [Ilyonectria robusta]